MFKLRDFLKLSFNSFFVGALALTLVSCGLTPPPETANSNGAATASAVANATAASCGLAAGTLVDERALFAAETAYNVPANAYVQLDAAGRLSGDVKARARGALVEAYRLLQLARSAYRLGDVCGLANYAGAATSFANRARDILPRSN